MKQSIRYLLTVYRSRPSNNQTIFFCNNHHTYGRRTTFGSASNSFGALSFTLILKKIKIFSNSPLWKRVIAWERSRAASGYGIIWGDADGNKQEEFMYQSNRSFNIPNSRAYPGHLTSFPAREGGNLINLVFPGAGI